MNQIKTGKFIAECRKKNNLTQAQLAEKLNITDRAISKWETGKAMPDSSIMLELCDILKISVNELLSGEVIKMENYNEKLEKNLLDMVKQKEQSDKRLLTIELIVGIILAITLLVIVGIVDSAKIEENIKLLIIIPSLISFIAIAFVMVRIEQVAGYYECSKCHYKYIPTYLSVLCAMHINRTRYMKCPKCNQRSWQKKVISK